MSVLDDADLYRGMTKQQLAEQLVKAREAERQALEDGTEGEYLRCNQVVIAIKVAQGRLDRRS